MKGFVVAYSSCSYDDYKEHLIFVTKDEKLADNYVEKANRILRKWLPFLLEMRKKESDNHFETYVFTPRYYQFNEIDSFYKEEIELR